MTDTSALNKVATGHGCCGDGKAQEQAPKAVAAEGKSGGGCCGADETRAPSAAEAVDPVCGMSVSPATAETSSFQGKDYFFCCSGCHKKFDAAPSSFLGYTYQSTESHHG